MPFGSCESEDGQLHAFVWSKHAGVVALETPAGTYDCAAIATNDAGEILGKCATDEGVHAVVWTK